MFLAHGGNPPPSFADPQYKCRALVIGEDSEAASQMVLDMCAIAEGPSPYLHPKWPQNLVGSLAECSRALHMKLFEVEFPSAIDVVESLSFLGMHDSFCLLSKMIPSSLAPSALESCGTKTFTLAGYLRRLAWCVRPATCINHTMI